MSSPILSIVTPVLNGQSCLARFIQRVVDQNCPNIEHILVDGASCDDSVKIIKEYAEKYSHIRWISEEDQGPGDALNKGIKLARGEFLGLLCLDDYYEPNTLNSVISMLGNLPKPTFLVGDCRVLDVGEKELFINKPTALSTNGILIGMEFPGNPAAYFYSKSIHDKVGFFSITNHYAVDLEFLLRCFTVAKVKYIDKLLGNFQLLESSLTQRAKESGTIESNTQMTIEQYLMQLSFPRRVYIRIARKVRRIYRKKFKYYINRFGFYLSHPQEIFQIVKRWKGIGRRR